MSQYLSSNLYFLIRVVMIFQISIFQGRRVLYKLLSGDMRYSREKNICKVLYFTMFPLNL